MKVAQTTNTFSPASMFCFQLRLINSMPANDYSDDPHVLYLLTDMTPTHETRFYEEEARSINP
jgi:hypothetical protein